MRYITPGCAYRTLERAMEDAALLARAHATPFAVYRRTYWQVIEAAGAPPSLTVEISESGAVTWHTYPGLDAAEKRRRRAGRAGR
jgi:hypothetical protein